ncbi:MAG: hypothetical protein E5Y09_30380 [Mesorhizobium sp.]|nr:MAG: hypothetical protein E5Y09_30380 [Mesorhizobium sp.]
MVRRRIVRISLTLVHLACFRLSMGSLGSMMREPKYQNGAAENRTSNPPRKLSGGLAEPLSAFCETRRVDLVEPATFEGPSPAQRLAVRQERSAPLVTELERCLIETRDKLSRVRTPASLREQRRTRQRSDHSLRMVSSSGRRKNENLAATDTISRDRSPAQHAARLAEAERLSSAQRTIVSARLANVLMAAAGVATEEESCDYER